MSTSETSLVPIDSKQTGSEDPFEALRAGLRLIGRAFCGFGRKTGETLQAMTGNADADVRAQFVELPFFGLTQLLPKDRADIIEGPLAQSNAIADRPVVLIHGLGGSAGNFGIVKHMLGMRGRRHVFRFDYRESRSMSDVVPQFEFYLRRILSQCPDDAKIDIIGHSMGGLITRAALRNDDLRHRVHHLVTLGTPHQGTHLARWGGFHWCKEIRPDSSFMELMNAPNYRESEKNDLAITSFWTERDIFVLSPDNAKLEGARNIAMHHATHVSWLVRLRQAHQVLEALDNPPIPAKGDDEEWTD